MADPYKNNVVLYLPMEGSCDGDTVILDRTGKTVTRGGDVHLSTDVAPPFGTTSAYFDGTGDYLSLADSADWHFGTADFTIECWVRFASVAATQIFVGQRNASTVDNSCTFYFDQAGPYLTFTYSSSGTSQTAVNGSWSPSADTWYHVAVSRNGSNLWLFVDGSQVGTTHNIGSTSLYNSTRVLQVGVINATPAGYLNGYLKDLRITKGIARYPANFYVDQKPFDWDNPEPVRIML